MESAVSNIITELLDFVNNKMIFSPFSNFTIKISDEKTVKSLDLVINVLYYVLPRE